MHNTETNNNQRNDTILESLYIKHRDGVYRKVLQILQNHEDAEDVVQRTFLAIAENVSMLEDISPKKARNLVYKIARNNAIDVFRHKSHAIIVYTDEYPGSYQEDIINSCLPYCIEMLPEKYKHALFFKIIHGYSNEEAAKILNISPENFRKRVYRAKIQLRAIYEKETLP